MGLCRAEHYASAGERLLWAFLTASGPRPRHTAPWLHRIWCIASRAQPLSPQQKAALQQLYSAAEPSPERILLLPIPALDRQLDAFDQSLVASAMAMRFTATSLAGAMEELGPACSSDDGTFRETAQSFTTVCEKDLAEVLGMMARSSASTDPSSADRAEAPGVRSPSLCTRLTAL